MARASEPPPPTGLSGESLPEPLAPDADPYALDNPAYAGTPTVSLVPPPQAQEHPQSHRRNYH